MPTNFAKIHKAKKRERAERPRCMKYPRGQAAIWAGGRWVVPATVPNYPELDITDMMFPPPA